ncbi:MAG TPA: SCO family protein [Verrucomicrobiae bacterium]
MSSTNEQIFPVKGEVEDIQPAQATVTIKHEAIPDFMEPMTMPYAVKDLRELKGLKIGDQISFQLHVTKTDSWVGEITKTGNASPRKLPSPIYEPVSTPSLSPENSIRAYKFTNELGQAVSFNDFNGQALAITFFYSRCPLPNYCQRLSQNFQEAEKMLEAMTNAPMNWHLISVSFDPTFDTPDMLKSYGQSYGYDPGHWSFFTGPPEKIAELARAAGVQYETDGNTITHNFRTLIVDASGHLQMVFPIGGDLSGQIVDQIIKAAAVTNTVGTQSKT